MKREYVPKGHPTGVTERMKAEVHQMIEELREVVETHEMGVGMSALLNVFREGMWILKGDPVAWKASNQAMTIMVLEDLLREAKEEESDVPMGRSLGVH